jgi:hypothetical protein
MGKLLIFISYLSKQASKRACSGWHGDCCIGSRQLILPNSKRE